MIKAAILLTTLATRLWGTHKEKVKIFLTTKSLWMERKGKKMVKIGVNHIIGVVVSLTHPEIVITTDDSEDNIRLETTSIER